MDVYHLILCVCVGGGNFALTTSLLRVACFKGTNLGAGTVFVSDCNLLAQLVLGLHIVVVVGIYRSVD